MTVPRSVQDIGRDAFLSNVVFSRPADYRPQGVLTPNMAREHLSKMQGEKLFVVPEGIRIIDFGCFMNSDVERVALPSSVKEIRWGAFYNCKKLKEVTLAEGLENIGMHAFQGTTLKEVVIPKSVKRLGDRAFYGYDNGNYNTTLQKVVLNEGLESIGDYCFYCNNSLKEVVIPSSVKRLEEGAFYGCNNLSSVTLLGVPESVEEWAFP